ncbi:MAG: DUF4159 domain-containing protein [Gemmatimonadetes bacterium]|nr:DUF4159 domain-containing protein [Gemmatimonadota bacterium]
MVVLSSGPAAGGPLAQSHRWSRNYNGHFTFTRIRYGSGGGFGFRGGGSWAHDYPRGDEHLSRIIHELTTVHVNLDQTNVFDLDDPEIFKNPVIYLSEPGFWGMNAAEAENLRTYLRKGGFIIFDDFELEQWRNFERQMMRVLPEHHFIEIGPDHPVFSSFFSVDNIYIPHPLVPVTPTYFAMFEENDPTKRMLVLVNYNNDVAEYWEWSDAGWLPVDLTNEAYKLGVNYIVYALTH